MLGVLPASGVGLSPAPLSDGWGWMYTHTFTLTLISVYLLKIVSSQQYLWLQSMATGFILVASFCMFGTRNLVSIACGILACLISALSVTQPHCPSLDHTWTAPSPSQVSSLLSLLLSPTLLCYFGGFRDVLKDSRRDDEHLLHGLTPSSWPTWLQIKAHLTISALTEKLPT